ncbi:hypothetical protein Pla110_06220 [Polystyrenella longa]|uniref:Uncharacterized protein n=1 Tax=Polystyrenella longa TaxID=2528007 RepID=A0A518CI57_9PLAN|nr:hypothetical protein [Polystyrenella longa]QDU78918.1 hypothetical protein Pla110_06220 [Polystyrenella longa]
MQELLCPQCNAPLSPVEGTETNYRCGYCGVEVVLPQPASVKQRVATPRFHVPCPEEYHLDESEEQVCITWEQQLRKPPYFFIFTLLFISFCLLFFSASRPFGFLIGAPSLFLLLKNFSSTPSIQSGKQALVVDEIRLRRISDDKEVHFEMPVSKIEQLYCRQINSSEFQLWVLDKTSKTRMVVDRIPRSDLALFLEYKIEHFLNIPDERVHGQIQIDSPAPLSNET